MEGLSRKEQQLSDALLDLGEDAMVLVELDGFVAGILVSPEMIPPSDWLPLVWNSEGSSDPIFKDLAHANKVMGLVMEYYNQVALALFEQPDSYAPLFPVDTRNDDVIWEVWIEGFDKAAKLRPQAWLPLAAADTRTAEAWRGLMKLAELARAELRVSAEQYRALSAGAPEKIASWVLDLNDWRLAQYQPPASLRTRAGPFASASAKVGRNAACPCGSGKKYKRCCGLN